MCGHSNIAAYAESAAQKRDLLLEERVKALKSRFNILVDLGTCAVPKNYESRTHVSDFRSKHGRNFRKFDPSISDKNFHNPSRRAVPDEKLRIVAFKQKESGLTSSEERLEFLLSLNSHLLGLRGALLAWENGRKRLPLSYRYSGPDQRQHLWTDIQGKPRVPAFELLHNGMSEFYLDTFDMGWHSREAFFGFFPPE